MPVSTTPIDAEVTVEFSVATKALQSKGDEDRGNALSRVIKLLGAVRVMSTVVLSFRFWEARSRFES